jgi:hypothetical protein
MPFRVEDALKKRANHPDCRNRAATRTPRLCRRPPKAGRHRGPGGHGDDVAVLEAGHPREIGAYVEDREGDPDAKLIVLISVEGEDTKRLERISEARGKKAADVAAELLRDADRWPA